MGRHCEDCKPGYYGNALVQDCKGKDYANVRSMILMERAPGPVFIAPPDPLPPALQVVANRMEASGHQLYPGPDVVL